jgi:hypothetical protein
MTTTQRLSAALPPDVAEEICQLSPNAKALLMNELTDEIAEKIEGFDVPNLSATSTQWLKSLTVRESLQVVENLSLQLMTEVKR